MTGRMLSALVFVLLAAPLAAQTSNTADERAGSWFSGDSTVGLNRAMGLNERDFDLWENAAKKAALAVPRSDLYFLLPAFDPLWDKDNRVKRGAIAKFAKRLEQLPGKAAEEWRVLTNADTALAAVSLLGENDLFPDEQFSAQRFETFKAKYH